MSVTVLDWYPLLCCQVVCMSVTVLDWLPSLSCPGGLYVSDCFRLVPFLVLPRWSVC